ncbi:MAG: helix-turn-helix transcriptional regulator [Firmicutes bacterium]|nr:helix-turn-helix transcriptional regulator [Bacillota bacterium]
MYTKDKFAERLIELMEKSKNPNFPIGKEFAAFRDEHQYSTGKPGTSRELADFLSTRKHLIGKKGVTVSSVQQWRTAKGYNGSFPPLDTINEICKAYNCDLDYLLGNSPDGEYNRDISEMKNKTGLSDKAIAVIINENELFHKLRNDDVEKYNTNSYAKALSLLIESGAIHNMTSYITANIDGFFMDGKTYDDVTLKYHTGKTLNMDLPITSDMALEVWISEIEKRLRQIRDKYQHGTEVNDGYDHQETK